MSYRAWQEHFGLDPSVIGATFMVDGQPFTLAALRLRDFSVTACATIHPIFTFPLQRSRSSISPVRRCTSTTSIGSI